MSRNDIARRIVKLEGITPKPGGIDWTSLMAKAATMPPIHSPFWDTATRVRRGNSWRLRSRLSEQPVAPWRQLSAHNDTNAEAERLAMIKAGTAQEGDNFWCLEPPREAA